MNVITVHHSHIPIKQKEKLVIKTNDWKVERRLFQERKSRREEREGGRRWGKQSESAFLVCEYARKEPFTLRSHVH